MHLISAAERRKLYQKRVRELARFGFRLPFEMKAAECHEYPVTVAQSGVAIESPLADLAEGRNLFVVWLTIASLKPSMASHDFVLLPPWEDHGFEPLPDFADSHIGDQYVLPGGLEYARGEIINFQFTKAGWRLPLARIEGVHWVISSTPIPHSCKHGALRPITVRLFGHSREGITSAVVELWLDRSSCQRKIPVSREPGVTNLIQGEVKSPPKPRPVSRRNPSVFSRPDNSLSRKPTSSADGETRRGQTAR